MFDPVPFLGPFGVVEPVEGPDQVAGDPPDPLEGGGFQLPGKVDVIPVYLDPDRLEAAAGEFLPQMADVGVNLLLGEGAAGDGDFGFLHIHGKNSFRQIRKRCGLQIVEDRLHPVEGAEGPVSQLPQQRLGFGDIGAQVLRFMAIAADGDDFAAEAAVEF